MNSLKSIFALALIMLVAASCGKKDDAAAAGAGSDSTAVSEDAKAYVGKWETSHYFQKMVLNLKEDGKYEIEYYQQLEFDQPLTKVATAGGEWHLGDGEVKHKVYDKDGNEKEEVEKIKVLKIKPNESLLKILCSAEDADNVKGKFATWLQELFTFNNGVGSIPNVSINSNGVTTVIERDGNTIFDKATEAQAKPAQEAAQAEETSSETLSFEGTVAGKHVTGDVTLEGDTASGRYAYDGSSAYMLLSGSYDSTLNILSLNESYDGNNTGTWNVNYDKDAKTISGTMVNFKGKEYKVELKVN